MLRAKHVKTQMEEAAGGGQEVSNNSYINIQTQVFYLQHKPIVIN